MHRFNRALANLYDLAEQASPNDFPVKALNLLQHWIEFDGAVWWTGGMDAGIVFTQMVPNTHKRIQHRNKIVCGNSTPISTIDSEIKTFLNGLESPIQWIRSSLCAQNKLHSLQKFVEKYQLQHLMLFGEDASVHKSRRWLMLYREKALPFNEVDGSCFHTAWFHLDRSLDINRSRVLDRHDPNRLHRASALIDAHGFIFVADHHFHRLLANEWPNHDSNNLPQAVITSFMLGTNVYRGRRIEIVMTQQDEYLTCCANAIDVRSDLTASEYMVARRYATGLSHKTIARELGISPHTVRNQIAHLYDKLGVHDKAALAQHLALQGTHQESRVANTNQFISDTR